MKVSNETKSVTVILTRTFIISDRVDKGVLVVEYIRRIGHIGHGFLKFSLILYNSGQKV